MERGVENPWVTVPRVWDGRGHGYAGRRANAADVGVEDVREEGYFAD